MVKTNGGMGSFSWFFKRKNGVGKLEWSREVSVSHVELAQNLIFHYYVSRNELRYGASGVEMETDGQDTVLSSVVYTVRRQEGSFHDYGTR